MRSSGYIAILVLVVIGSLCGYAAAGPKLLSYSDSRFSLQYPSGWSVVPDTSNAALYKVNIRSPDNAIALALYGSNNEFSGSLGNLVDDVLENLKAKSNFKLISRENITLKSNAAVKLIYTWTTPEGEAQKTQGIISVVNKRSYTVYGSTSPGSFETGKTVINQIISSITIKPVPASTLKTPTPTVTTKQPTPTRTGLLSYSDSRFSLQYPSGWSVVPDTSNAALYKVNIRSPDNAIALALYGSNNEFSGSLGNLVDDVLENLKAKSNFKLISRENITLKSNAAVKLIYTWTTPEGEAQKTQGIISVVNKRSYTVYGSTSPGSFETGKTVINQIISSITIKPVPASTLKTPTPTVTTKQPTPIRTGTLKKATPA